jgi:hypothetical protein
MYEPISHGRYQCDNSVRPEHPGACPRQHSQQLVRCFALDRLHLPEWWNESSFTYPHNHKAETLNPNFLVANVPVAPLKQVVSQNFVT